MNHSILILTFQQDLPLQITISFWSVIVLPYLTSASSLKLFEWQPNLEMMINYILPFSKLKISIMDLLMVSY